MTETPLWDMLANMMTLLALDIAFLAVFILALIPLSMYRHASFAVLRRNFFGYFNNPTGYIFLCVFVVLTSIAAFWPPEFFNANLANLDQLNFFIPLIMLVFIPAITMSVWAEERRQGTDELLLTLPADDFDIVLGKYLAAVAIFSASLLFSQIATYWALVRLSLGDVDIGLFFATYFGYWLLGVAMLAIGMVASFLTSNLTIGFILGALFNAPIAAASYAVWAVGNRPIARFVEQWSFGAQFEDLGRGVISLSSLIYFIMIAVVGIYLCIVLIGRRHWRGGRDGNAMLGHYLVRALALIGIALAANALFMQFDVRQDVTAARISSLSPDTRKIMRELDPEYPIKIEAFLSDQVPEQYAQTKKDLIATLNELEAHNRNAIEVTVYNNLKPSSEEAILAEERYNITPQTVQVVSRGTIRDEEILMGLAVTSGLEKVVVPFIDYGIPIEYELIRSIATVAEAEREKIGIVSTDAQLFGGFSFAGGQPRQIQKQPIVEELEKQYEVEEVDPSNPIDVEKYRALLVVQPSSLTPPQFDNLLAAIRGGIPTAVFEDPLPNFMQGVPGTDQPKQPQGMFGGQPQPKAEIGPLMDMLGVKFHRSQGGFSPQGPQEQVDIVWQRYNPYEGKLRVEGIPAEWVFIRNEIYDPKADELLPFNANSKITNGLEEVLFPWPGAVRKVGDNDAIDFQPLVMTGDMSGTVKISDIQQNQADPLEMDKARGASAEGRRYTLAAWIKGKSNGEEGGDATENDDSGETETESDAEAEGEQGDGSGAGENRPLNVIFVADIDLMAPPFVYVRARPQDEINWRFDNVTFVLNVLDALVGDESFMDIRKRKVRHSTLKLVEKRTETARERVEEQKAKFQQGFDEAVKAAREDMEEQTARVQKRLDDLNAKERAGEPIDVLQKLRLQQERQLLQARAQRKFDVKQQQLRRELERDVERIEQELERDVQDIQNGYKITTLVWPVILPLLIGLVVFVRRRMREREGISRARLK